jgi:glycerol-3-phosphate dehydrogenase
MGRCQGGFCGPKVHEILARELNVPYENILMDEEGTYILTGRTKEGSEQ